MWLNGCCAPGKDEPAGEYDECRMVLDQSAYCRERESLWIAYNTALNRYVDSTKELGESANTHDFPATLKAVLSVRQACERARSDWEEHLNGHGCEF
jgi:hypothetical protein